MDWETLLTGAIGGSIINILWSYYSKRQDYDIEYKKYILSKRQEAYDKLLPVIIDFLRKRNTGDGKSYKTIFVSEEGNPIKIFSEKIITASGDRMWYTPRMYYLLQQVIETLAPIAEEIFQKGMTKDICKEIGIKHHENLNNISKIAAKQYFIDILSLNDIDKFKRQRLSYLKKI